MRWVYGRAATAADCTTLHVTVAERAACPTPATVRSMGIDGLVNKPIVPAYTADLPNGVTHQVADQQLSYARDPGNSSRCGWPWPHRPGCGEAVRADPEHLPR